MPPFRTHESALLPGLVPPPIKLAQEQDFRPGKRYHKKVYGRKPKRKMPADNNDLSKQIESDERRLLTQRALGGGKKGKVANNLVGGKSGLANYHSDQQKDGSAAKKPKEAAKKGFSFQHTQSQKGGKPPTTTGTKGYSFKPP
jgi:hypothetical protein